MSEGNTTSSVLSFQLNPAMLYRYQLTLKHIASVIEASYSDVMCVFSPTHLGVLDIWVDTSEVGDETRCLMYLDQVVMPALEEIHLAGIDGITQILPVLREDRWMIEASGFNLPEVLSLDYVDTLQTVSNHLFEIEQYLGIEATRAFLIQEFTNIISADSYINACHIKLLADFMTFTGVVSPLSRYGVHEDQSGPLAKASFEKNLDNFIHAGMFGEHETTVGLSASVICGKPSIIGSGLCALKYKEPSLSSSTCSSTASSQRSGRNVP